MPRTRLASSTGKRLSGLSKTASRSAAATWPGTTLKEVTLLGSIPRHVRHHGRFYASALLGVIVWAAMGRVTPLAPPLRLVVAGDSFFGIYLVLMAALARRATPDEMRRRASFEDEGIVLIILLGLTAISLSLGSIFAFLNQGVQPDAPHLVLLIASVPLAWLTLHTIVAFHYAHLYYAKAASGGRKEQDAGGLEFPDTAEPTGWDFLYYSLVVGMTAQVSDVQVLASPMRRLTLVHSVVSFFFNTVILALAVNLAAGQVR